MSEQKKTTKKSTPETKTVPKPSTPPTTTQQNPLIQISQAINAINMRLSNLEILAQKNAANLDVIDKKLEVGDKWIDLLKNKIEDVERRL